MSEIPDIPRRIRRLELVNFKGIRNAEINFPDEGKAWVLGGPNRAGKTSLCGGIWWVMGGAKASPEQPIRRGEEKAFGQIDLGDDVRVTRVATRRDDDSIRDELTVEFHGAKQNAPQTLCDGFAGGKSTASMIFDPGEFYQLDPKKQAEIVRALIGLDLSDLDQTEDTFKTERLLAGRDADRLKGALASMPASEVLPVDVEALASEYTDAIASNTRRENADRSFRELSKSVEAMEDRIADLRSQLKAAQDTLTGAMDQLSELIASMEDMPQPIDVGPIQERIRNAQATNQRAAEWSKREEVRKDLEAARKRLEEAQAAVDAVREERRARIENAKFPIDGLSIVDGDLRFNGLPLSQDQLSQSELLRIALAIRIAVNPNLMFAVLKNAALFDRAALASLDAYARESGFILILERPDVETGITAFVIEDGLVREV